MKNNISDETKHFFHVVSNIRPIVWIGAYVALMPIFGFIYWGLPDTQFRIPDGAGTDYWSWLYYSVVTITTLGFGDYTPAHLWAQIFTALEVMLGLVILGFFLNAVGSMKSEIDVTSEVEKQKRAHAAMEREKLLVMIPGVLHTLGNFLSYCYAVTTPISKRGDDKEFDAGFTYSDMADMFKPSGLPNDHTRLPAASRLISSASQTSLALDSLQSKVDLALWPEVLDDCFSFVASYQMFSSADTLSGNVLNLVGDKSVTTEEEARARVAKEMAGVGKEPVDSDPEDLHPVAELYYFIKENAAIAMQLEQKLNGIMAGV